MDLEAEMAKFVSLGVKCVDILDKEVLLENKTFLDKDVQKKLKDLNYEIDYRSEKKPFKKFVTEIAKLHPTFEDLKKQVFSANKRIELENGLRQLKLSQYRHSNEGKTLEENYTKAVNVVNTKKAEIDTLRKKIVEETKNVVQKNQTQINKILKDVLKADFTIQKLSSHSNLTRSDSHFIEYEFVIDGNVIL